MSDIASLELCKELYELSGWSRADLWCIDQDSNVAAYRYDLGYLLHKLPARLELNGVDLWLSLEPTTREGDKWTCHHWSVDYPETVTAGGTSPTPEDAACSLAIELFEKGILKRDAVEN